MLIWVFLSLGVDDLENTKLHNKDRATVFPWADNLPRSQATAGGAISQTKKKLIHLE